MMDTREYQQESVRAIFADLKDHRSTLLVLPTGTGKTHVASMVTKRVTERKRRVLFLAHRTELVRQAEERLRVFTGEMTAIEMGESRGGGMAMVVVASVQSIVNRLDRYPSDHFALVIVDEAHHATASTYGKILGHFHDACVLGLTATPDRADGVAMGNVFESVAFEYDIRDAISAGYLSPIRQATIEVAGLDLASVRTTAGDLNAGDLEAQILRDQTLHEIAAPLIEERGDRPTMVFVPTVRAAHELADVIDGYNSGASVAALDGASSQDERERVTASFREGGTDILVNCSLFTEGFDAPRCSCVAIARPTKSRALYAQMIGRGTRTFAGKSDLLVLDFVGNAGRHKLISPIDVLDGGEVDDEYRSRVNKLAKEMPVHAAMEEAARQIASERRALALRAGYKKRAVDPFTLLAVENRPGRHGGRSATERQLAFLERRLGSKNMPGQIDRGQASALIDAMIERQNAGLCTPKQAATLARFGIDPDVTFERAGQLIDAIANNGWKVPAELKGAA